LIFFRGSLFFHPRFLECHAFYQTASFQSILSAFLAFLFLYFHSHYSFILTSSFNFYFESISYVFSIAFECSFKKLIDSMSKLNPFYFICLLNFCISKMEHF
jgi:hypothetical protein